MAACLEARSGELRLVVPPGTIGASPSRPNETLIRAIRRAWGWQQRLLDEPGMTLRRIAAAEGISDRYVGALIRLGFLAPDIVEAILDGRQPVELELQHLLREIPLFWPEQRRRFGFELRR